MVGELRAKQVSLDSAGNLVTNQTASTTLGPTPNPAELSPQELEVVVWPQGFIDLIGQAIKECGMPLAWPLGQNGRFRISEAPTEEDSFFLELQNLDRITFAWIQYLLSGKIQRSCRGPHTPDGMDVPEVAAFLDLAWKSFNEAIIEG